MPTYKRYEELRPDELETLLTEAPIAHWPLGLLEHHGWHLPIGFDGLKAERTCRRLAARTGGTLLPTMWWGGGGGHDVFKWTHYQNEKAIVAMLAETSRQLLTYGFRVLVLMAGHYPWQSFLDAAVPALRAEFPDALILAGTEMSICGDAVQIRGDHAACEETSFGLALFPELVELDALTPGRDDTVWPGGTPPPEDRRHPKVEFDPAAPLYAQMGEDAHNASAAHGEEGIAQVVDHLAQTIDAFLNEN
jgi:creatinine amidohydrolase